MTIVSSYLAFPNIAWWHTVIRGGKVIFDKAEHYQKMSYRNRYKVGGANNCVLLSVPLAGGRNQNLPMREVQIYGAVKWQVQHWRTLVSTYNRSPYFDHYATSLERLYLDKFTHLVDFDAATIDWVIKELRLNIETSVTDTYVKDYASDVKDIRNTDDITPAVDIPRYYQVFEDRIGFIPNLSILDMMFSEGPETIELLI